jgi:TolB-like protein
MAAAIRLALCLAVVWTVLGTRAWAAPTVAVLDLSNDTGDRALDGVGAGVANIVVSRFAQADAVDVVERQQLRSVLDEVALSASGAVDPEAAVEAGRLLGADYLVVGSLFSFARPELTIHLRVVDAAEGRVVVSNEVTGEVGARGESMFVLIDALAFGILDALQIELKAAQQIELRQVDVREMQTLGAYGRALEALDAGRPDRARAFLDEALALEPGFGLARSTLDGLATEVRSARVEVAAEVWTDVQAYWDALDEATRRTDPEPVPSHIADLAIQARLHALRGELDAYHALEARRVELFHVWWNDRDRARGWLNGPTTPLQSSVAHRLSTRGEDHPGNRPFASIQHYPWEVGMQRAILYLLAGQRQEAMAQIEQTYRFPGPVERGPRDRGWTGPAFPDERCAQYGLFDMAVALTQQRIALAELAGDEDERRRLLPILEERVAEARDARADREAITAFLRRVDRKKRATPQLVEEELALMEAFGSAIDLREPAYRAFLARVDDGFYRSVRKDEPFARLATAWHASIDGHWGQPLGIVRRVEALLALHEQLGAPDRDERIERRAAIQALLDEAFQ